MLLLALLLTAAQGRPLFYWGSRAPVIETGGPAGETSTTARVVEVHAALDAGALRLRFSFDRRVREALYLPDGTPVSGRLSAVLYIDRDDDRASGLGGNPQDARTGADARFELGVLSLGADPEEKIEARAIVTVVLYALAPNGKRRQLWQRDDASHPDEVSAHGEWVEVRVPGDRAGIAGPARLILAVGSQAWEGRFPP